MRIGMYETSVKYLLGKYGKKFLIDFLQTELIPFYLLNIADLIPVDPFSSQDSLFQFTSHPLIIIIFNAQRSYCRIALTLTLVVSPQSIVGMCT